MRTFDSVLNDPILRTTTVPFPERVFRYRPVKDESSIDRVIDFEIIRNGLYLCPLKKLNDPNEGRFLVRFNGTRSEVFRGWFDLVMANRKGRSVDEINFRCNSLTDISMSPDSSHVLETRRRILEITKEIGLVVCFTEDPLNLAMWAHYANIHKGIVIEYDCSRWQCLNFCPVEYTDEIPSIEMKEHRNWITQISNFLYIKTTNWSYEKEWRILKIAETPPNDNDFPPGVLDIELDDCVKAVIFGKEMPAERRKEFMNRISPVRADILFKEVYLDLRSMSLAMREMPPI